jgi:hypothetical protein
MRAGYDDSGADPADWSDEDAATYAEKQSGWVSHLVAGLAAGLLAGGISAAMADARMGLTANGLISGYERGFFTGASSQGTVQQSTWHATQDKETCDLCSERDGTVYPGDPPYWPGDGGFGDEAIVCRGSVNCRCEVEYEVVPVDQASVDVPADVAAMSLPDLLRLREYVAKYSDDQPRDDHGRFASEGGDGSESVAGTPEREPARPGPGPGSNGLVDRADQPSRQIWDSRAGRRGNAEHASAKVRSDMKAEVMKAVGARIDARMTRDQIALTSVGRSAMQARPNVTPGEAVAAHIHDMWATTSGDSSFRAIAFQKAVAEEFGLKGAANPVDTYRLHDSSLVDGVLNDNRELFRTLARAEYENTQEFFAKQGITELTLFRGMILPYQEPPSKEGAFATSNITMNPLSSMSASAGVAESFARTRSGSSRFGYAISAKVPVSRVFSTSMTGAGCLNELETVILGGDKDEWTMWHV